MTTNPTRQSNVKTTEAALDIHRPSWMTNAPPYQRTFLFHCYREAVYGDHGELELTRELDGDGEVVSEY